MISLKQRRRHLELGGLATRDALWRAMVFIVSAHCACPSVMVGDMGRSGEMWGDVWRYGEMYEEIWGDRRLPLGHGGRAVALRLDAVEVVDDHADEEVEREEGADEHPEDEEERDDRRVVPLGREAHLVRVRVRVRVWVRVRVRVSALCRSGAKPTCNRVHWAWRWD